MPDAAAVRIEISDSCLARRLRGFALLATGLMGWVMLWTWAVSAGGWRLAVAFASFAMLADIGRWRAPRRHELAIAAGGTVHLRVGQEAAAAGAGQLLQPDAGVPAGRRREHSHLAGRGASHRVAAASGCPSLAAAARVRARSSDIVARRQN